ncbi:hypothetical protein XENORESO_006864 [Xenotaenia resolanae]|uniref:Uncharacterized protein n=1 Tax=Xenotaenia resolanae TaxID=208358 RepID=A0ABV0X8Q6_9TELE
MMGSQIQDGSVFLNFSKNRILSIVFCQFLQIMTQIYVVNLLNVIPTCDFSFIRSAVLLALREQMCACGLFGPWQSYLAVFQVGVNVLDESVIGISNGENQLAERAAPHVILLTLHPELQSNTNTFTFK